MIDLLTVYAVAHVRRKTNLRKMTARLRLAARHIDNSREVDRRVKGRLANKIKRIITIIIIDIR